MIWPAHPLTALVISGLGQLVLVEVVHVGGRIGLGWSEVSCRGWADEEDPEMLLFPRDGSVLASSIGFDTSGQRSPPYGLGRGVGMDSRGGARVAECVFDAALYRQDGRGSDFV